MESLDILAEWLKANDPAELMSEEAGALAHESRAARAELEKATAQASACQVAEDDIAFLEAIGPVKAGLAQFRGNLERWEAFLQRIEPRL